MHRKLFPLAYSKIRMFPIMNSFRHFVKDNIYKYLINIRKELKKNFIKVNGLKE